VPFKNFVDGARLDDTDLNRYFLQQAHVIKSVDESVTSSIVMQDDNELFLALLANTQYWFECFIFYGANATADIRIDFTVPAGTTYDFTHSGLRLGHSTADGIDNVARSRFTEGSTFGTIGGINATTNAEIGVIPVEGRISTAGTAGNIRLQFCQDTSNATSTVVKANSVMIIQRLTV